MVAEPDCPVGQGRGMIRAAGSIEGQTAKRPEPERFRAGRADEPRVGRGVYAAPDAESLQVVDRDLGEPAMMDEGLSELAQTFRIGDDVCHQGCQRDDPAGREPECEPASRPRPGTAIDGIAERRDCDHRGDQRDVA